MKKMLLSHCSSRDIKVDMLVLHCSAQPAEQMVKLLDDLKLSTHYIVGERGEIIQCVEEDKSAWHAGKSFWRGYENINSRSIGIELCSETLGQKPYSEEQIISVSSLCKTIIKKYSINPYNVVGHSDIAPSRKPDPGIAFPWKKLAKEGIGLWYDLKDANKVKTSNVAELLAMIGYDTSDENILQASVYAFCRRFLPEMVAVDNDIMHLVDNVFPKDFSFDDNEKFILALKACAYKYSAKI